jgi:hypothetical protein
MEHSLGKTGIVTRTALVNTVNPLTVLIKAKEQAITANMQRDP